MKRRAASIEGSSSTVYYSRGSLLCRNRISRKPPISFLPCPMDTIFSMDQVERANYLQMLMQSVGSTYICLWSYLPSPSNCLISWDGFYHEEYQPGTRALFHEYRQGVFPVLDDRVPGQALLNNSPYIELNELDLQRKASVHAQRQFYQEARIKSAVFMGCKSGEIELGWSRATGMNIKNEMKNLFPEDFSRQSPPFREVSQAVDPGLHSSSSSSLRSVSMDSPDSSSFLFDIPGTSHVAEALQEASPILQPLISTTSALLQQSMQFQPIPSATTSLQQALQSFQPTPSTSSQERLQSLHPLMPSSTNLFQHDMHSLQAIPSAGTASPHQQAFALTTESVDATIIRAILAVLTSPSSSSSTQNLPNISQVSQRATAFNSYFSALNPKTRPLRANLGRQSMLKRAIIYYRSLHLVRRERMLPSRPTSTQLHHVISERRRREKLNESFQALRSLLPRETKKDKASILNRTREHLNSLRAQIEELSRRNRQLEEHLSPAVAAKEAAEEVCESSSSRERIHVQLTHVPESTSSEHRVVNLQVTVRGGNSILNSVIRILEFLKQVENVNLMSIQAVQNAIESNSSSRIVLTLRIEGSQWDESAFQEAIRRIVAD